jgi:hypothetical protein
MIDYLRFVIDDLSHFESADVATDPTLFDCVGTVIEVADYYLFAA